MRRIARAVVRVLKAYWQVAVPQRELQELHVFLVRTGEYRMGDAATSDWPLTKTGKQQAQQAGRHIRDRIGDATPTVMLCLDTPRSYRQTAVEIADILGVETHLSDFKHPPYSLQWPALQAFGGPIVIVVDGTNLQYALSTVPGPPVELGILGPPFGSVHELVITYYPSTPFDTIQPVSQEFA